MTSIFDDAADDTLFQDRSVLGTEYVPDNLVEREKEINQLKQLLQPAVQGARPMDTFLVGNHGAGKTVSMKWMFEELEKFDSGDELEIIPQYMSCQSKATTEYNFLVESINSLREYQSGERSRFPAAGHSLEDVAREWYDALSQLCESTETVVLIFGLDEVDNLDTEDRNNIFDRILRASNHVDSDGFYTSITGTSNRVGLLSPEELDSGVRSRLRAEEIAYEPYDGNTMQSVVRQRIEKAFSDGYYGDGVVQLLGALGAKHEGDARIALDLLSRAGDLAERENADQLTEDHVRRAEDQWADRKISTSVESSSANAKTALASLILTEKEGDPEFSEGFTIREVYEHYQRMGGDKKRRTVRRYIGDFEDARLVNSEYVEAGNRYKCYSTVHDHDYILKHMLETIKTTPLAEYVEDLDE